MHFKPSVIVLFAAMLTVTIAAPTPASEMKEKRVAAPGGLAGDHAFIDKSYAEREKRSDEDEDSIIYYKNNYPESENEKRSDEDEDSIIYYKNNYPTPESEKRATTQEFGGRE